MRSAAVAEQMAAAALADFGRLGGLCNPVADVGRTHAFAVAAEAQGLFDGIDQQMQTGPLEVGLDPLQPGGAHEHHPAFVALAAADHSADE